MNSQERFILKPHHFLDIMKLYGIGIVRFVPNFIYSHDFFKVANRIIQNPEAIIALTAGSDDICAPCRFNKDGHCADLMPNNPVPAPHHCAGSTPAGILSKDEWNRIVDERLLDALGLKEDSELSAIALAALSQERLTRQIISEVWRERPTKEIENRMRNLQKGLDKYITKYRVQN